MFVGLLETFTNLDGMTSSETLRATSVYEPLKLSVRENRPDENHLNLKPIATPLNVAIVGFVSFFFAEKSQHVGRFSSANLSVGKKS